MKINDDESNSVPERINLLDTKLQSIVSNQTGIVESLSKLNNTLNTFHDRIDKIAKEEKDIKNLEMKLSSIKKEVEMLTDLSKGNEDEINNITNILASLNITSAHNNNSNKNSTPKTSQEYEPFHLGRP